MRPIKFRGRRLDNDNFVYGYFDRYHNKPCVDGFLVYPDSVARLVGYDANGAEVYEGDAMTTRDGVTIYAAILYHAKIAPAKDFDFSEEAKRDGWTLKTE